MPWPGQTRWLRRRRGSYADGPWPASSSASLPGLGDQGEHVVRRDRVAVAVGDQGVPTHLTVVSGGSWGDLLDGQGHRDLVAGLHRGEEAQVVDAEVRQHRPG